MYDDSTRAGYRKQAMIRGMKRVTESIVIVDYVEQPERSGKYYIVGRGTGYRIAIPGTQTTAKIKRAYDEYVAWALGGRGKGGYTRVQPSRNLGRFGVGPVLAEDYRR